MNLLLTLTFELGIAIIVTVEVSKDVSVKDMGVLPLKEGGTYEGELLQGKMHGQGKITYPDGRTLEGTFLHNKICRGKGTLVMADQKELTGEWKNFRFYSLEYLNILKEKAEQDANRQGLFLLVPSLVFERNVFYLLITYRSFVYS